MEKGHINVPLFIALALLLKKDCSTASISAKIMKA